MRKFVAAAVAVACLSVAVPAAAAAAGGSGSGDAGEQRYRNTGGWTTDAAGRVVVLRGVNMVNKIQASGYAPDALGFGADDARFLAASGFNIVRLGLIWKAVEPAPGRYDEGYLDRIERTVTTLRRHGIAVMLDFHQDMFNERFQGEGAPDWAVLGRGVTEEPTPRAGFPTNYLVQPAVSYAFDAFWVNAEVPGTGRGVQDLYAGAWAHVAERFAGTPGIVGYNLLNEPWMGTAFRECLGAMQITTDAGCGGLQEFEAGPLTAFHRRVAAAIREVDRRTMIWHAPTLAFDFGARSGVGRVDANAGFAFNAYCAKAAGFDAVIPAARGRSCRSMAEQTMRHAQTVRRRTGDALFLTEFGAGDDLPTWSDYLEVANDGWASWAYWSYWNTDPSGEKPIEGVIHDLGKAPAGANVKTAKLALLAQPFPAFTAGVPRRATWVAASRTYRLTYTTRRAGGGRPFGAGSVTTVNVPALHYRQGYGVRVDGARVVSGPGARVLRLGLCPGARTVAVRITPGRTAARERRCA